ncbi:MAG: hypothetical protein U0904_06025 [Candidatus Nanopelagicales bacterium]|nr:hypothetical protein [Candidatus Nanopelagicales bacterium]
MDWWRHPSARLVAGCVAAALSLALAAAATAPVVTAAPEQTAPPARETGRAAPGKLASGLPPVPGRRMFAASSPFNQPIPRSAPVHPSSAELVARLFRRARSSPPVVAVSQWSVPVLRARKGTKRQSVTLTANWSPYARMVGVPIPRGARPDPQGDGHLAIIAPGKKWLWELWQARRKGGRWLASWGTRIRLASSGVHRRGLSARGSGFALTAGLIWPRELRRGRIAHALLFSAHPTRRTTFVAPATESDGTSRSALALPEGARLRLDPAVDLSAFAMTRKERVIAVALQRYGMFLGDDGGSVVSLYQVNPSSFRKAVAGRQPWRLYDGVAELPGIPWDRLQVLDYQGSERRVDTDRLRVTDPRIYR